MSSINKLTLAKNLTARVNGLCSGLEDGTAEILNLVSDTTAELLRYKAAFCFYTTEQTRCRTV